MDGDTPPLGEDNAYKEGECTVNISTPCIPHTLLLMWQTVLHKAYHPLFPIFLIRVYTIALLLHYTVPDV